MNEGGYFYFQHYIVIVEGLAFVTVLGLPLLGIQIGQTRSSFGKLHENTCDTGKAIGLKWF